MSPQAVMLVGNTLTILLLQLLGIVIQGQEIDDGNIEFDDENIEFDDRDLEFDDENTEFDDENIDFEDRSNGTLEFDDRSIGLPDLFDRSLPGITVGPNNVRCGKSTTVPINNARNRALNVGLGEKYEFRTTKKTRRCVATYAAAGGCPEIRVRCPDFYVPNTDPAQCRKPFGDSFRINVHAHQPEVYCADNKPTKQFPAAQSHDPPNANKLKIWYDAAAPTYQQRNKGVRCYIECSQ